MRIEYALTISDPKSASLSNNHIKATDENRLLPDDILMALGVTQTREKLGLHLLYAKYKKDPKEKSKAHKLLTQIAYQQTPPLISKLSGRLTAKAVELLALLAIEDYCRTADTPGAKCHCGGRGTVYDLTATRQLGRPVEKTCVRCNGLGIRPLPAARAYRVVTKLIPTLTQQTWSRNWKPFYQSLIARCYLEESAAVNCFNHLAKTV